MFARHLLQNCKFCEKKKKKKITERIYNIYKSCRPTVRLPDIQLDKIESNDDNNDDNSSNSTSNTTNNDPPPQFKIMRRSAGSSSPSSRASGNDDQSKTDRKNMTYEERKTAYEEARARIFQNMEK